MLGHPKQRIFGLLEDSCIGGPHLSDKLRHGSQQEGDFFLLVYLALIKVQHRLKQRQATKYNVGVAILQCPRAVWLQRVESDALRKLSVVDVAREVP